MELRGITVILGNVQRLPCDVSNTRCTCSVSPVRRYGCDDVLQRMYMLNDEKVRTLTLPVLFISGRQDKLVPPSHMDVLYSVG